MWRGASKQNETTPMGQGEDYIAGYGRRAWWRPDDSRKGGDGGGLQESVVNG